jgi:hypothetical protein
MLPGRSVALIVALIARLLPTDGTAAPAVRHRSAAAGTARVAIKNTDAAAKD